MRHLLQGGACLWQQLLAQLPPGQPLQHPPPLPVTPGDRRTGSSQACTELQEGARSPGMESCHRQLTRSSSPVSCAYALGMDVNDRLRLHARVQRDANAPSQGGVVLDHPVRSGQRPSGTGSQTRLAGFTGAGLTSLWISLALPRAHCRLSHWCVISVNEWETAAMDFSTWVTLSCAGCFLPPPIPGTAGHPSSVGASNHSGASRGGAAGSALVAP